MKDTEISEVQASILRLSGIDLSPDDIVEPAASSFILMEKIDKEALSLSFDVEPSNHTKLLHDLAPDELKNSGYSDV
tara:strand:+ start:357 stop:587 length:231 start_codon:yes stop_codon:yes gene_type:complete